MIRLTFIDPPKTYTQDGVCLTESGMSQLQSLTVTVPRRKRTKPKLKLKIINQNSVAVLQTPPDAQSEHSRDGEMDDSRGSSLLLACLVSWSVAVHVYIADIPESFYYTDNSCVLYRMLYGKYLDNGNGSLLSISGIFLVFLFMDHPSYRKLTFLRLVTLEIWVAFLSNPWFNCLTEYKCILRLQT